jgi:hypothetical protein
MMVSISLLVISPSNNVLVISIAISLNVLFSMSARNSLEIAGMCSGIYRPLSGGKLLKIASSREAFKLAVLVL